MNQRGILNNGDTISYAYGQGIGDYKGLQMISHGGGDAGYRTFLIRFPEEQYTIVVFGNFASFNSGQKAFQIADIYLKGLLEVEEEKEPVSEIEDNNQESDITVDIEILNEYIGKYELFPGFLIDIRVEEEQLVGQATGQPSFNLHPNSPTEFVIQEVNATIIFKRNDENEVNELLLLQGGQEIPGKKLADFDLTSVDLKKFTGSFYSSELQTTYQLKIENDTLKAYHQRHDPFKLTYIQENAFAADAWFFGSAIFILDESGSVTGLNVTNGRVRNLEFIKYHQDE